MKNIFIFDLDSTVVEALTYDKERICREIDQDLGTEFRQAMSLEAHGYTHMVFPGFCALFRWIRSRGDSIYFFSTGIEKRNLELVPKLMEMAFGNKAKKVLAGVRVFSRQHCINTENMSREEANKYQPHRFYGRLKKKLEELVVTRQELPWSLLIDDDFSYMVKGEEENFLYVPSCINYYSSRRFGGEFRGFHKACYIRGVLEKILGSVKEKNIPLTEAAGIFEKEIKEYRFAPRDQRMLAYFEQGLELLQEFDPDLRFYFDEESLV